MVDRAGAPGGIKVGNKKLKINFSPPKESEGSWPAADHKEIERPPIPC